MRTDVTERSNMRVILLGPPGAGKGTQAKLMEQQLRSQHLSSGDLLRDAVAKRTDLGLVAKTYMDRGELAPDDLVIRMIEQRLLDGGDGGFILDGFPRNVPQAEALDRMLARRGVAIDHVFSMSLPREEITRRLSGRRTCRSCNAVVHFDAHPPRTPGRCDRCGGELFQRDDDREETIAARLDVYERATAPLRDYYRARGLLREVDALGRVDEILDRILSFTNGHP